MEMLTKNYEDGSIGINCDDVACKVDGLCPETSECECVKQILKKLAVYESIGTIEEFKALKEKEERFDRNIKMFNSIGLEIRNKSIDETIEKIKNWLYENNGLSILDIREINEIVEQLKGGAT